MSRCYYHPASAAKWECEHCCTPLCDQCADESGKRGGPRCFQCQAELNSLGASHSAEPFWRKLSDAFRYPANAQAIVLIVLCSLGSAVAGYIPFSLVIYLLALGAILRYAFTCLKTTAMGKTSPPEWNETSGGGLTLVMQLFAISLVLGLVVFAAYHYIGAGTGGFMATLSILVFPAIVILFADRDSLLEALNPINILQLILALGTSYGVLLGMIMIMMASVEVLHSLVGERLGFIGYILQGAISNYYLIVTFHIMGLMIFQHQGDLGYIAREDSDIHQRSDKDRHLSKIDIAVKRGDYNKAVDLYVEANSLFPQDIQFYERCFDLLCAARLKVRLERFFPHYVHQLEKHNQTLKIYPAIKKMRTLLPQYNPETPQQKLLLAQHAKRHGDPKLALQLLLDLPKAHPQFAQLNVVMRTLSEAFLDIGKTAQAEKAAALADKLDQKLTDEKEQTQAPTRKRRIPKALKTGSQSEEWNKVETAGKTTGEQDDNGNLPPIDFKL